MIQLKTLSYLLLVGLCSNAIAGERPKVTYSVAEKACTDSENWDFGSAIPAAWGKHLKASTSSPEASAELFSWADQLKISSRNPEAQALSNFFIGKSFYAMKLYHLAHDSFDAALAGTALPSTIGVKLAALDCLAEIRSKYPSIVIGKDAITQLLSLGGIKKNRIYGEALAYVLRMKSTNAASPDNDPSLQFLLSNKDFSGYFTLLQASSKGDDAQVIQMGEKFLASAQTTELKKHSDLAQLLLGQAYYDVKNYNKSAQHFRAVESTSNYLTSSLTAMGWAQLQAKNYPESLAASRNLLAGILSRTFAPEANIIASITFAETCHYAEALKSLSLLKTQYSSSYRWLYNWNKSLPASSNLYPKVAEYLEKKSGVPDKIATEWLRSPLFQANQEELNLIFDEKVSLRKLAQAAVKFAKNNPKKVAYLRPLSQMLQASNAQLPGLEKFLVAQINSDLSVRTRQMLLSLVENMENSQLVEADVYTFVGDKILADNIPSSFVAENGKMKKPENHKAQSGWDWGRAPANDDAHAEVWDDELGFLQATLSNNCDRR